MKLASMIPVKGPGLAGLLVLVFYLTSSILASDLEDPRLNGLTLFGEPGHDDTHPVLNPNNDIVDNVTTGATTYQLQCGKTGQYTTFCKRLPYQFSCNPDTGKSSVRISNLLCGLVCQCKKVSADTTGSEDHGVDLADTADQLEPSVFTSPITLDQPNAELVPPKSLSDLPECARNVLASGLKNLPCDGIACVCKTEQFVQDQCKKMKSECSPQEAKDAIKVSQAICSDADAPFECATASANDHPLEPRGYHHWAFVCDHPAIPQQNQRTYTFNCQKALGGAYSCDANGRLTYQVRKEKLCEQYCRCVYTNPQCVVVPGNKTPRPWLAAGCSLRKRDENAGTALSTRGPADLHVLERRHNYGFVCDSININPNYQRETTQGCMDLGYYCTDGGKMQSRRRTVLCDSGCRCVKVQNCAPKPALYPEINFWWNYCQVVKAVVADDGSAANEESTSAAGEVTSDGSAGIEKPHPFGLSVEKRNDIPGYSANQLERRHNYGFVCDIGIQPSQQRKTTNDCRSFGMGCDSGGKVYGKGATTFCDNSCRCVNVVARCDLRTIGKPGFSYWQQYCHVGTSAETGDDHSTQQLERRHNYAFVCDIGINPNHQRQLKDECRSFGMSCNARGRVTGKGHTRLCDGACRCVNVVARCSLPNLKGYWQQFCSTPWKRSGSDDMLEAADEVISLATGEKAADEVTYLATEENATDEVASLATEDIFARGEPSNTLERRHDWGIACDMGVNPNMQRYYTRKCIDQGYSCNWIGEMYGRGRSNLCDRLCRCFKVVANCDILKLGVPKDVSFWQQYCPKTGTTAADADNPDALEDNQSSAVGHMLEKSSTVSTHNPDTNVEPTMKCFGNADLLKECGDLDYTCTAGGLLRSSGEASVERCEQECTCVGAFHELPLHDSLMERQAPVPTWGPWQVWCSDSDSIHDPDVTEKCKNLAWYGCDNDGNITRPTYLQDCEIACACIQEAGQPLRPPMLESRSDEASYKDVPALLVDREDPEPAWGPWRVWCADADSVHDPLLGGNCQHLWKYRCNDQGNITRPAERKECEKGCMCIQEPVAPPHRRDLSDPPASPESVGSSIEVLLKREPVLAGHWTIWCGDVDSIRDPQWTYYCRSTWKYACTDDNDGNVIRPKQYDDCEVLCSCVRETNFTVPTTALAIGEADEPAWDALNQASQDDSASISKRQPDKDPNMGPWKVWCSDVDSINDPQTDVLCTIAQYHCDGRGNLIRPKPDDVCDAACACIQEPKLKTRSLEEDEVRTSDVMDDSPLSQPRGGDVDQSENSEAKKPCNNYHVDCGDDNVVGGPNVGGHPLCDQCNRDQKCTLDGKFVRKDGKPLDPKSTCGKFCSCSKYDRKCKSTTAADLAPRDVREDQTTDVEAAKQNCQKWEVECCDTPVPFGPNAGERPFRTGCIKEQTCTRTGQYVRKDGKPLPDNDCTAECGGKLYKYKAKQCDNDDALPNDELKNPHTKPHDCGK